jgi:hypothetical protein
MKTYKCKFVDLDGRHQTESIPACDAAAALGVLLDEQDVDEHHPIEVAPRGARKARPAPAAKRPARSKPTKRAAAVRRLKAPAAKQPKRSPAPSTPPPGIKAIYTDPASLERFLAELGT